MLAFTRGFIPLRLHITEAIRGLTPHREVWGFNPKFTVFGDLHSRVYRKVLHLTELEQAVLDNEVAERRNHSRHRVLQNALILFNNGHCSMGCQILDMSDTGARLIPADIFFCPKEFVLKPKIGESRDCAVMWRNGTQMGVRYLQPEHQIATPDERRHQPRRRALQKALIVFNNGRSSMRCQILDASDTGAKLKPDDIFLCPREFVLKPQNGGPRYCVIMWRKGSQIGVRYG